MGNTVNTELFKNLVSEGHVIAPFVYDGLQAKLAQQVGLSAIYMTGFGSAARLGLPDVGLMTFTEMLDNARIIVNSVDIPVICDADTGYGSPVNVIRTVREYENAGVAALHLEDQQWPKRCGYMAGKSVIPSSEMIQKLRAALDARQGEMMIIARTDALQSHGWNEVEDRSRIYMEEGVDMIFVDGVGADDVNEYARRLGDLPILFNNVPQVPMIEVKKHPFSIVLHAGTLMAILLAIRNAMVELKNSGDVSLSEPNDSFELALQALDAEHYFGLDQKYSI